jgi:uncharacterized protein DUF1573
MSNEFGTVSVRRDRAREIDLLRQQYSRHRETLTALAAAAPSEHLASEYQRLIREIDLALGKLGELEGRVPADTNPSMRTESVPRTEPGSRPLVTPPSATATDINESTGAVSPIPRIAMIIIAGVVVLAIIGWLMWRASGERPLTPVHPQTQTTLSPDTAGGPVTPAPKPLPAALALNPASHDYGVIRRGTRAVRQFQVTNNGDQPVTLQVERSKCRCLYYEYPKSIAPHAKETVTVTVDGAKAKPGALRETVAVSSKQDPSVSATMQVNAVIR